MKQTFSILLFILISINGFGQCDDIDKLELGGTYLSRTRNYIPFEIKHKDSIEREKTFYPYDIKNIGEYSDFILKKAKEYIVTRASFEFYNKLVMGEFQVNYLDNIKAEYDKPELYKLSDYNVTYWILYTYRNNGFEYAFGLEFNKNGKMISESKFPESSLNPEFESFINPCIALEKVKSDKRFKDKKVDFIELAYLDDVNSFCWLVKEKTDQPKNLGLNYYSVDLFYVNANKNIIELIKEQNGTIIACGLAKPRIVKKKN